MLARSCWQCRLSGGWRQKETECAPQESAERRVGGEKNLPYLSRGSWEMKKKINVGQLCKDPSQNSPKVYLLPYRRLGAYG